MNAHLKTLSSFKVYFTLKTLGHLLWLIMIAYATFLCAREIDVNHESFNVRVWEVIKRALGT
jgi:hypothetical protein